MVDALTSSSDEGRGVAAISFGEVLSNLRSGDVRMGKPASANRSRLAQNARSLPAEVKHLIKRRNRKKCAQARIPQVAAREKGIAQTCWNFRKKILRGVVR